MPELTAPRGAARALAIEQLTYAYPRAARPALERVSVELARG